MIVTITNSLLTATINTLGAELISLVKNNKNYIWNIDETYWNKTSPVLFPIVGRLKNDTYSFNEKIKKSFFEKIIVRLIIILNKTLRIFKLKGVFINKMLTILDKG